MIHENEAGRLLEPKSPFLEVPHPRGPGLATHVLWAAEEIVDNYVGERNFARFSYHFLSMIYLTVILWLCYVVLPLPGHWPTLRQPDTAPLIYQDLKKYV
jgi:hypothetical protein